MKKLIFTVIALLLTVAGMAQTAETNRVILHQKDGTTKAYDIAALDSITFDNVSGEAVGIEVTATGASSATVKCTKPESVSKYYIAAIPDDGSVTDIRQYVIDNHQKELTESGTAEITGLTNGRKYLATTLAFDKYGIATETATAAFSTLNKEAFEIALDDFTWGDAHVVITPADQSMRYYYYAMPMSKVNSLEGGIDGIMKFDRDFWQYQADMYSTDINEIIQEQLISGRLDTRTSDIFGMAMWGTDAIVYCYGIDNKGNAVTSLSYKTFKTTTPVASDNEFTVKVDKVYPSGVEATITPKNNDTYFFAVQRDKFVNYWQDKPDTLAYQLLQNNYKNPDAFANGEHKIAKEDFSLYSGQHYNIIVFGYNNGLSTPVKIVPFITPRSASSTTSKFEEFFYDENGNIDPETLKKVDDKTYAYYVDNGNEPCTVFGDITLIEAVPDSSYSYSYDSGDGTVKLDIKGSTTADTKGIYATMDVNIPDHPEITKILFVSVNYGK